MLFEAAGYAEQEGLLERRQVSYEPTLQIPVFRCPSCSQATDFGKLEIVENAILCPYWGDRVEIQ
jgi:hypothetical protein